MPLNHRFMPDIKGSLRVRYSPLKLVMHEPIPTKGLTPDDAAALKDRVYDIIRSEFLPEAAGIPAPSSWRAPQPQPHEKELA